MNLNALGTLKINNPKPPTIGTPLIKPLLREYEKYKARTKN